MDFKIKIGTQVDVSDIKKQIENAKFDVKFKISGDSLNNLKNNISNTQKNVRDLTTDFNVLEKTISTTLIKNQGMLSKELINDYKELEKAIGSVSNKNSLNLSYLKEQEKLLDSTAKSQIANYREQEKAKAKVNADAVKVQQQEENSIKIKQQQKLLINQINSYLQTNTRLSGESAQAFKNIISEAEVSKDLKSLQNLGREFRILKSDISIAGQGGMTLFDDIKTKFSKFTSWFAVSNVVMQSISAVKNAFTEIIALDDAMVELRKVTEATNTEFDAFYYKSNDIAKALGNTTAAVIQTAASYSQLGYSLNDAITLTTTSSIFKTISPEMKSVEEATEGLISILKAFKIEADDALDGVVSKVNIVGNNFAVTNSDIVTALEGSAASLQVANNSLEESIALITAGTEITRDSSRMGNALRTISMRIRGLDEETGEAVDSLKQIDSIITNLTGKQISLFTDDSKTTYRSTYEILKDISKVWNTISDKNQADLLETLAGKNRANELAAVLSNWSTAEGVIEKTASSAGSAMSEFGKASDSISFKLNRLSETMTGFWQNLMSSDAIKVGVDSLTGLLSILEKLSGSLGSLGTIGTVAGAIFGATGKGWRNDSIKIYTITVSDIVCPYRA